MPRARGNPPGTIAHPIAAGRPGQSGAGATDMSLVPDTSWQGRRLRSAPRIIVGQSVALRSIQNALYPVLYRRLLIEFFEVLDMINGSLQRMLQVLKS